MLGWCTCCCSCWWCTAEGSTAAVGVAEGGTRCQRSSASSSASASAFRFRLRAWGLFLALACLRARTPLLFLYCSECGGGEDEIGEQSRKGGEEERKGKVAVEMDGQEGVESSLGRALIFEPTAPQDKNPSRWPTLIDRPHKA